MRTWHKALIAGVTTECVTTGLVAFLGEANPTLFILSVCMHIPALVLIWLEMPLAPSLILEASLWVFVWFVLLSVFSEGNQLTKLSLGGRQTYEISNDE